MNEYIVYITVGGIMEMPGSHDVDHMTLEASSVDEAVDKWFPHSQCHDRQYLKKEADGSWSYWGWPIKVRKLA